MYRGYYERALEKYHECLDDWPKVVYPFMGQAYERQGRWAEAVDAYEKGIAAGDSSAVDYADSLGMVWNSYLYYVALCRTGRWRDATARMEFLADSLRGFLLHDDVRFDARLVDFLAGRLSEKRLWNATAAKIELEEASNQIKAGYYLGMVYFLGAPVKLTKPAPDVARAREYLERAVSTDINPGLAPEERERAAFELKRLGGP